MNPTISRAVIEAAYERDPAAASAEYGAQFRTDVQSFLPAEAIEACVVSGRRELPPVDGLSYYGFVDPSGGASDAFTIAVAHLDKDRAVLDLVREVRPPFSPEATVREFAETLRRYRVFSVTGDRYGGEWPREQFSKLGIEYRVAEKTRSELYLEMLPAIMSGQMELLDNARLVAQLGSLERRTARGGRDSIEHSPGTHDDVANAGAGALVEALRARGGVFGVLAYLKGIDAGTIPFPERLPPALVPVPPSDCPSCGSELIVSIGGGGKRCQQCGTQFGIPQAAWRGPDRRGASRKR